MSSPLLAGEGQLSAHWNGLQRDIAGSLDANAEGIEIENVIVETDRIASLGGVAARRANRLRGQSMLVVKIKRKNPRRAESFQ
jgi:hypothetical protein